MTEETSSARISAARDSDSVLISPGLARLGRVETRRRREAWSRLATATWTGLWEYLDVSSM